MPFLAMTIWVVRPRPMHQMARHQNKKSPTIHEKKKTRFGAQKLAVGGRHVRHAGDWYFSYAPTGHPCGPNLVPNRRSHLCLTLLNIFFLPRFSKKIGNCQNGKKNAKMPNAKMPKMQYLHDGLIWEKTFENEKVPI